MFATRTRGTLLLMPVTFYTGDIKALKVLDQAYLKTIFRIIHKNMWDLEGQKYLLQNLFLQKNMNVLAVIETLIHDFVISNPLYKQRYSFC